MRNLDQLKVFCEYRGYEGRRYRFQVISELFGVDEETAKGIERVIRYMRKLYPRDTVAHQLEHEHLEELGYNAEHIHDRT